MFMEKEVRDAFGTFLQRWRWSHFLTVTFAAPRLPHHAESTVREVEKYLSGPAGVGRFFIGTELHLNRTLHLHGLLHLRGRYSAFHASLIFRECRDRWGRSSVSVVQSREAVTDYVAKYVSKELTAWWLQA